MSRPIGSKNKSKVEQTTEKSDCCENSEEKIEESIIA